MGTALAMQLDFASLIERGKGCAIASGSSHAARFRFAPSRSRAAPYAIRKEWPLIRASTMSVHSFLIAHGLSLACKFAPIPLYEEEYYDQGYDEGYVESYPFGEFWSFAGVGFGEEVFPAPSVTGGAEENVYQAAKRQEVVAYDEVLKVEDCRSFSEGCESAQYVIAQYAGHGKEQDCHEIDGYCFSAGASGQIHCEGDDIFEHGNDR